MIEQLYELVNLINDKYPPTENKEPVRLLIYPDGSGFLIQGTVDEGKVLLDFSTLGELVEHLSNK